ncbi:hypothetical protein D1BOALGB6SA_7271 [Olavius sp. associated proteobacterium Delta 1]|nr:hypothetical protein D1BOALGB6SA_7271 [Olavius sp. associated proteobacterium Delta 1]
MKPLPRVLLITLLLLGLTACTGHDKETRQMTLRERIGNAYGVHYFSQIEQIQYRFNVKIGEKQISRFWIWEPKLDRVTFKGMNYQEAVTYYRHEIDATASSALKKVDAWFINDNYWLLFPFHIAWDTNLAVEDIGRQNLPLGGGKAKCVVITFPASGGYTPGDVYEIYLNDNSRLLQWVYRHGGSEEPTRVTTWENYRQAGPLVLSLNRQARDESFRLWFTGVGVKLVGVDNWMFTE